MHTGSCAQANHAHRLMKRTLAATDLQIRSSYDHTKRRLIIDVLAPRMVQDVKVRLRHPPRIDQKINAHCWNTTIRAVMALLSLSSDQPLLSGGLGLLLQAWLADLRRANAPVLGVSQATVRAYQAMLTIGNLIPTSDRKLSDAMSAVWQSIGNSRHQLPSAALEQSFAKVVSNIISSPTSLSTKSLCQTLLVKEECDASDDPADRDDRLQSCDADPGIETGEESSK